MNFIKHAILLFVLSASLLMPQILAANEQGFGVPKITAYPEAKGVSRLGKVTGEGCRSDNDCMVGCTSGQPDDLKCLTQGEASNECVSPDEAPKADYPCACLSDVNHCGFLFVKKESEQETVIAPPVQPKPTAVKKPQHKKAVHKKTPKKKNVKPKAAAPTPITPTPVTPSPIAKEPAHDSGQ